MNTLRRLALAVALLPALASASPTAAGDGPTRGVAACYTGLSGLGYCSGYDECFGLQACNAVTPCPDGTFCAIDTGCGPGVCLGQQIDGGCSNPGNFVGPCQPSLFFEDFTPVFTGPEVDGDTPPPTPLHRMPTTLL